MEKYKQGRVLTYIPKNVRCVVVDNSLTNNDANAVGTYVTVLTDAGDMYNVPTRVQDEYLTTAPPKKEAITGNNIAGKPGLLQRLFGPAQKEVKK